MHDNKYCKKMSLILILLLFFQISCGSILTFAEVNKVRALPSDVYNILKMNINKSNSDYPTKATLPGIWTNPKANDGDKTYKAEVISNTIPKKISAGETGTFTITFRDYS